MRFFFKNRLWVLYLILFILTSCGNNGTSPAGSTKGAVFAGKKASFAAPANALPYAPGELLVKFREGALSSASTHRAIGAAAVRRFTAVRGLEHVKLPANASVEDAIVRYMQDPLVEYAEPNYARHAIVTTPNDPNFGLQWALQNTGQTVNGAAGAAGADISAPLAWDIATGGTVIIAGLDSGIDYTHADIVANMWTNPGETSGDGIDNDGNGYIDDVHGINAITGSGDPMDDDSHGTHTAGTMGAVGNNATGVAGVNWSTKLMALKFLDSTGAGFVADEIEGIQYAINNGAKVINASFGDYTFSNSEKTAIESAATAGIVFVAAAGNDGTNNDASPFYPANYSVANIISVAATDQSDALASFSNFGAATAHLGAPGVNIISTVPVSLDTDGTPDGYSIWDGTSMAAPHVAGAAGLVWAVNSSLAYAEVVDIILANVDLKASLSGKTTTGGRLDVNKAALGASVSAPAVLAATAASSSLINLLWIDNSSNETGFRIERKAGSGSFSVITTTAANVVSYGDTAVADGTAYTYRVRAANGVGVSYYTEASAVTPLNAPTVLTATAASSSQIDLAWVDNSVAETGFKIERKTGSGGVYAQIAVAAADAASYSDTAVSSSTQYFYRVRAYNASLNSAYSNESSATPSAPSAGGGSGGGGCFIATAAYGSYLAPEVMALREFRDRSLLTNPVGRAFVKAYYKTSPPLARFIARHETLRTATRAALTPVVYSVKYPFLPVVFVGIFFFILLDKRGKED